MMTMTTITMMMMMINTGIIPNRINKINNIMKKINMTVNPQYHHSILITEQ